MNQLKKILIATDFSPCADSAFKQAVRMARLNQAQLHVVHAIDGGIAFELAELLEASPSEISNQLKLSAKHEIATMLQQQDTTATVEVQIGTQIESVVTYARQIEADILIVGEHGEQTNDAPAGVLVSRCLRKGPAKVMLVDRDTPGPFTKVLACVDFSQSSQAVVEQARRVASQDGGEVKLLHVFNSPWERLSEAIAPPPPSIEKQQKHLQSLNEKLEELSEGLKGVPHQCEIVSHSNSAHAMTTAAKDWQANLIIVGKRGYSRWPQMMLGSTAESLVREPNCSVLAVNHLT